MTLTSEQKKEIKIKAIALNKKWGEKYTIYLIIV